MKKIAAIVVALGFATQAHAQLSDSDKAWMDRNGLKITIPLTHDQTEGLHWLINNDCGRGKRTVGGIEMQCKGSRAKDVNEYLSRTDLVNFAEQAKKNAPPVNAAPANDPLTPADYAYVKTLDRTINTFSPKVMTPRNRAALHRLIAGAPDGRKNDATNFFLDSITFGVDGDEIDSVDKQARFRARLGTYLTTSDREWMASQKLPNLDPVTMKEWIWTVNQYKGLHWMLNNDCKPGPMKVGGVDITCKGSKLDDVKVYIGTVNTTLYYWMTHDGG